MIGKLSVSTIIISVIVNKQAHLCRLKNFGCVNAISIVNSSKTIVVIQHYCQFLEVIFSAKTAINIAADTKPICLGLYSSIELNALYAKKKKE